MHATFCFLVATGPGDPAAEAVSAFASWSDRRCDENNWSSPMALVTKAGAVLPLGDSPDWRDRHTFAPGFEADHPDPAARFAAAETLAASCVASEMEAGGATRYSIPIGDPPPDPLDGLDAAAIRALIARDVPARLATAYAGLAAAPDAPPARLADWSRAGLSRAFEAFRGAERPPFADGDGKLTPYDYRAFDLTGGEEPDGILFVDIHT